jgi:hypothetical protein
MTKATINEKAPVACDQGFVSFVPDEISEAMITAASDYFLSSTERVVQQQRAFRQDVYEYYYLRPQFGRALLAAGLLKAGFRISVNPVEIEAPSVDTPEKTLDHELFLANWHNVVPTLIDMGEFAMSDREARYNAGIAQFAAHSIGMGFTIACAEDCKVVEYRQVARDSDG